jgi:hypothetical protein
MVAGGQSYWIRKFIYEGAKSKASAAADHKAFEGLTRKMLHDQPAYHNEEHLRRVRNESSNE